MRSIPAAAERSVMSQECLARFQVSEIFMQVAILIVLVLIAVIIAPWLIGVAIAAVAVYGIYLVAAAALAGVAFVIAFVIAVVWVLATEKGRRERPEEIQGERKACKYCQVEMAASAIRCKNCGQAST